MAVGMAAVEQEITMVVGRLKAADIQRRLKALQDSPEVLAEMTGEQVVDYLNSGPVR